MSKFVYLLVAAAVVVPSVLAAARVLYLEQRARAEVRAAYASTDVVASRRVFVAAVHFRFGPSRLPIVWRPWAAAVLIVGASLWFVGVIFLLFVRAA